MSKGKEIAEGIKNTMIKNDEIEAEANRRKSICDPCSNNSANDNHSIHFCKLCGCLLKFKQRSPESKCPENKW